MKINILDKSIFNRIAAGEVVEGPSSVVKELFENSIDAGATCITISITNGGLDEIYLSDDGEGIEKTELNKVFLPHATSKIATEEDLDNIDTLGFRGEALASISSVAKVTLTSKTEDGDAYTISCDGGDLSEIKPAQCVKGTVITVKNLFYNVPARLNFAKTPKGEETDVTSQVEKLILANPYTQVKYMVDDRVVYQTYGEGLRDVVSVIYGNDAVDNSFEISTQKNGLMIRGFLGNTNFYKGNRTYQTTIVNGRCINNTTLSTAINNAYSSYLMKRQYPFYVLVIDMPKNAVDVNVHPRKLDVRFTDNRVIYSSIYSVVSKVIDGSTEALEIIKEYPKKEEEPSFIEHKENLNASNIFMENLGESVFTTQSKTIETPCEKKDYSESYDFTEHFGKKKKHSNVADFDKILDEISDLSNVSEKSSDDIFKENKEYIERLEKEKIEAKQQTIDGTQQAIDIPATSRFIGQILKTYLIIEQEDNMVLIDQHAAHERLLFNKFYDLVKNKKVYAQQLLIPYTFTVNEQEAYFIYGLYDNFEELGFEIQMVGENTFRVFAVPMEIISIDFDEFFKDVLTDSKFKDEKMPTMVTELLAKKACKSAIKSGYTLSKMEIDSLMGLLNQNFGLKCPHGRPIAIKIKRTEIDKWFKRIV